jgi:hypothetical protein
MGLGMGVAGAAWHSAQPSVHAELAARRALNIARLREYAARGEFPRQRRLVIDVGGPYTESLERRMDECRVVRAFRHLMERDGQEELVKAISDRDNDIAIMHITGGPAKDWIMRSGFTHEECAAMDGVPSYGPDDTDQIERIRTHLVRLIETLERDADASLAAAVDRWSRRL